MSFVPLQGRATWVPQHPPRDSEIEFSGPARTIRMPMRGAIPVLTRAMRVEDAHPSVGLLSGATLLAMKLVAAGRIRLSETGDSWRVGPLHPDDEDRLRALATARAHGDTDVDEAEDVIRQLLDAVADTMTRTPAAHDPGTFTRRRRWSRRPTRRTRTCPTRCGSPCGSRRPPRCSRAAAWSSYSRPTTWTTTPTSPTPTSSGSADEGHGFSRRARLSLGHALRAAAEAWPPLDRLQRMQVPDRMVLDADELAAPARARPRGPRRHRHRRVLAAWAAR